MDIGTVLFLFYCTTCMHATDQPHMQHQITFVFVVSEKTEEQISNNVHSHSTRNNPINTQQHMQQH